MTTFTEMIKSLWDEYLQAKDPSKQILARKLAHSVPRLLNEIEAAKNFYADFETVNEKYMELLLAVERVYSGESRHETALRYIKESERAGSKMAVKEELDWRDHFRAEAEKE